MTSSGRTRKAIFDITMVMILRDISAQASLRTAKTSHVKWLITLFPQKGNRMARDVCTSELIPPENHDTDAIDTYTPLLMMIEYLKGLQMATYRSKAIMPRSKHSVDPIANPKNICTAQPKKVMFLFFEIRLTSVEGTEDVV